MDFDGGMAEVGEDFDEIMTEITVFWRTFRHCWQQLRQQKRAATIQIMCPYSGVWNPSQQQWHWRHGQCREEKRSGREVVVYQTHLG